MDDIVGVNRTITVDDLSEDWDGFGLWEGFFVFYRLREVFIAQLGDDEDVGLGIEDIMDLDDILGIFELLKDSNLILE